MKNRVTTPRVVGQAWSRGDGTALDRLMPLLYDERQRLDCPCMRRERLDRTVQATSLVNEEYLRLIDVNRVEWRNRAYFSRRPRR